MASIALRFESLPGAKDGRGSADLCGICSIRNALPRPDLCPTWSLLPACALAEALSVELQPSYPLKLQRMAGFSEQQIRDIFAHVERAEWPGFFADVAGVLPSETALPCPLSGRQMMCIGS